MSIYPRNQVRVASVSTERVIKQYVHEMTGKLHSVEDAVVYDSGFRVRKFVLTSDDYSPQFIAFQLLRDNVELIDGIEVGTAVKVLFKINGREWEGKFFNNLEVQSIVPEDSSAEPATDSALATDSARNGRSSENDEVIPF
jgi:hypothetical protein